MCQLALEVGVQPSKEAVSSPFTVIVPEDVLDLASGVSRSNETGEGDYDLEENSAVAHLFRAPIWQQPPRLVGFQCERPVAKALGKLFAQRLPETLKALEEEESGASLEEKPVAEELASVPPA